ncbi:MAG TPA: hypothetical protein VHP59_00830 [Vineibacter terrae]|nr:hypothetical protein [Vineibacter terrae]HEX2884942.1 hypothetical protein [Vineibacter terrae]
MSIEDGTRHFLDAFSDPQAVARYVDGPRRYVPGLSDLHRMAGLLSTARAAVDAHVNMLTPEQDEAILRDAGFTNVSLFFAAFTWRGWVAYG